MPPRYAYWTILIDGKATAFRAHERDELLPTFNQLARKNRDIVMRYFAKGRLWDTPEQAQWAARNPQPVRREPRDRAWRPGGEHKDPRARFSKPREAKEKAGQRGESRDRDRRPPAQNKDPRARFSKPREAKDHDRQPREPRFDARAGKRPPRWTGPPKRKGR